MEMITAEVIAEESSNYRWAVQIAAGRADGIRKDMAVINPDGLVGKIIQVNEHVSTVLLLIDPQAAARVRVGDASDRGTIKGNGAGRDLTLDDIGPNSDVEISDEVITAGYDLGIFPPGIPIGVVTDVSVKGAAVDKTIDVETFVDYNTLDFVQVLLESGPRLEPGADEEKVSDR
jgi:rod shape-determining protein MreC